jgi:putative sigma-54 modulation protein
MDLHIIGKNNVRTWEGVEDYIQKKIGKLDRYLPSVTEAKVEVLEQKTKSRQDNFTVQVTLLLNNKGTLIRGEETSASILAAVDAVYEVLERQIKRYKDKLYKKGRGTSAIRQPDKKEEISISNEVISSPRVSKIKSFVVNRNTVDEAVDQMELLNHDFFLFVNSENDVLSLVYRRKAGDYGLIEPELS